MQEINFRNGTARTKEALFCVALVLAVVAGCSSYEPNIRTGMRVPTPRTLQQIVDDEIRINSDFENVIRNISKAADAKAAIPKIAEFVDRMKPLVTEMETVSKTKNQQELDQFRETFSDRKRDSDKSLQAALAQLAKVPNIPPDFRNAVVKGLSEIKAAQDAAKAAPAVPPPEILPDKPPEGSAWIIWLLCVIILAACVAFLFRDGLWANAVLLVNVLFAGLLAMNFYEPVANWLTNFNSDVHTFVVMLDFLSLWTCFIVFVIVFRAATEAVSRVRVRFPKIVDLWGGVVLSACVGWVMMGFVLASLHAAPLAQYPLFGAFQPQNAMFFGLAPDREWLGFTRYQSQGGYCRAVDQDCSFPPGFIEKQLERRMFVEDYINANADHAVRVNPQMVNKSK